MLGFTENDLGYFPKSTPSLPFVKIRQGL